MIQIDVEIVNPSASEVLAVTSLSAISGGWSPHGGSCGPATVGPGKTRRCTFEGWATSMGSTTILILLDGVLAGAPVSDARIVSVTVVP